MGIRMKGVIDKIVEWATWQWANVKIDKESFFIIFEHLGVHQDSNSQGGSSLGHVRVHSLTLSFTPSFLSWPATLQALTLVASPRLGL